jgi:hypothetical protein
LPRISAPPPGWTSTAPSGSATVQNKPLGAMPELMSTI